MKINTNTISTKIKIIGILFIVLMFLMVSTTMYLSVKNKRNAFVINIAGKERMLTQRISKNILYIYHNQNSSTTELNLAKEEFVYNLNSLKNGNKLTNIYKAPTNNIAKQISKIEILWNNFDSNITKFENLLPLQNTKENQKIMKSVVNAVYNSNNNLLEEVDKLVSLYTTYSENKMKVIRYFQYGFIFVILLLIFYSLSQLKKMEKNAKKFLDYSHKLVTTDTKYLEPIKIEAEEEIEEATDTLNSFINKVNSAMDYSAQAVEQSKNASFKLEEITDEFDKILNDMNNSTEITSQLNKSEDMVIQSTEELMNSTKKLQELKKELDKVIIHCQNEKK